jgi:hypothetical protein
MQCVVTGQTPGEACPIYPASLGSPDIFNALVGLWDEKRARRAAIRTLISGSLYKVSNTICLCPSLRDAWLRGEFALKPLSQGWDAEEKKHSLKIALYWMRKSTPSPCYYHLLAHDYLMTDDHTPRYTTRAVNIYTGARVVSGDIFTVWADKEEDLPDRELLNLQWDIIRMASLCAGAEPTEIDHEDSDDDSEDDSEEDPEEGSEEDEEDEEDSDVED